MICQKLGPCRIKAYLTIRRVVNSQKTGIR